MKKIGIIGAPGSGKSTLAAGIFFFLKSQKKNAELVIELIKTKMYQGVDFSKPGFDILNNNEQTELEDSMSKTKDLEFLVCEAPLCNGYFYSSFYKKKLEAPLLKEIAISRINTYDILVFVQHVPKNRYESFGRKESYEKSIKLEKHIKSRLKDIGSKQPILFVDQNTNIQEVIQFILK